MPKDSSGPVHVFDWTIKWTSDSDRKRITKVCRNWAKHWTFQLEETETYKHWQGRWSLKQKKRLGELAKTAKHWKDPWPLAHFSMTSTQGSKTFDYVMKADTRVDGPWSDTDAPPPVIPRQYQVDTLYPWQQAVVDTRERWEPRTINVLYDKQGCRGKSTLMGYLCSQGLARTLPPVREYKDIMRMVMDLPTSTCYFIDMPRAMKKDRLGEFYSAIETLKGGYAWDDRYSFREKWFDSPVVWVFTNTLPVFDLLTKDRWSVWEINSENQLVPSVPRD